MVNEDAALLNRRVTHMTPPPHFSAAVYRLAFWQRVYMQGLPALCYNRLNALHDAVGREVKIWERHAIRSRDYVPGGFNLGRGVNGGREIALN